MAKYQMSFPTWVEIKTELEIFDTTNPIDKFGNCPFQKSSKPLWGICEQIYKYKGKRIGIDVPVLIECKEN